MAEASTASILKRNFLFRDLPDAAIEQIAALARLRDYTGGEMIFSEGDAGDALYAVASGSVRVSTSSSEGKTVFLNLMEYGDIFGEVAVLDGEARTATAEAVANARLIVITRADFLSLLERESVLALHLLRLFCRKLRWTTDIVHEATLLPVPKRIAKRLLGLARSHGRRKDGGLELQMSQSELASFLGISRQIVNQNLQTWREAGWIELSRSRITIRDADEFDRVTAVELSD